MENKTTSVSGYQKLLVYQRITELVLLVYKLSKKLPGDEKFGLISQMRRAVVSVLSTFVEGYLKSSKQEKRHYLEMAMTSLLELEAQSQVCHLLRYWSNSDHLLFMEKKNEVGYLLYRYMIAVR
ncbi:MAG: four helix bundle protein [Candidatus Chisholmbacteria bacterium]|nr:four helix bundle protein [Candidatus Chisholmbacteria bacterium]